jgi:hypothetical protein
MNDAALQHFAAPAALSQKRDVQPNSVLESASTVSELK